MARTIEQQQDSIKGKWESSGATKYCLKCYANSTGYTQRHYPKKNNTKGN